MNTLESNVQYLKGVGPKKALKLKQLGIMTIEDLILNMPRGYEDRSKIALLKNGTNGEKQSFVIEIIGEPMVKRPRKGLSILQVPVRDSSAEGVIVWFNQNYLREKLVSGGKYLVYGKFSLNRFQMQILNPEIQIWKEDYKGSIFPIYSLTEGLSNKELVSITSQALKEYVSLLEFSVPDQYIKKRALPAKSEALLSLHFPENIDSSETARKALAYEELLLMQLGLFKLKEQGDYNSSGISFIMKEEFQSFIEKLSFELTNAQKKVLDEITNDMQSKKRMNRLLQGDVGSGKTIVGIAAMYLAVINGYQAAMMAPTELLSQQHYETVKEALKDYKISIELLTSSVTGKSRESLLENLKRGKVDILIGTHAVIQEMVEFLNLGLAITDEQHRFGVKQRLDLSGKGNSPDVLVMTATPIPRTLALILYGDMDISIIDELPPGRKQIESYAVGLDLEERIFAFVRKQVGEGRQAYIVCPLIDENVQLELVSAEGLYKRISTENFSDCKVGLLHGRMNQKEKDSVMREFKHGSIDILISTTVIEVGVNVPNANTMVVLNSERFGLAQLHQLRGRIGRGEYKSYCILVNRSNSLIARERMRILQSTSDGFVISELDLELRGPGDFFGTRQHGLPELKIANLIRDIDVLKQAQEDALEILAGDRFLASYENIRLKSEIARFLRRVNEEIILN